MNSNNLVEFLQTGFRVSLGATASLVEILQDSQKREENLNQLRSELSQKVTQWAEKGETTEQEARNFIEQMWQRQGNSASPGATETSSTPAASQNTQQEIEELTAQIAAIRTELQQMRESE